MAVTERDVVLIGKDSKGNETIDLPLTHLSNIKSDADVKASLGPKDYIPVMDSADEEQMKKITAESLAKRRVRD